jgi:hypothetical protein
MPDSMRYVNGGRSERNPIDSDPSRRFGPVDIWEFRSISASCLGSAVGNTSVTVVDATSGSLVAVAR